MDVWLTLHKVTRRMSEHYYCSVNMDSKWHASPIYNKKENILDSPNCGTRTHHTGIASHAISSVIGSLATRPWMNFPFNTVSTSLLTVLWALEWAVPAVRTLPKLPVQSLTGALIHVWSSAGSLGSRRSIMEMSNLENRSMRVGGLKSVTS